MYQGETIPEKPTEEFAKLLQRDVFSTLFQDHFEFIKNYVRAFKNLSKNPKEEFKLGDFKIGIVDNFEYKKISKYLEANFGKTILQGDPKLQDAAKTDFYDYLTILFDDLFENEYNISNLFGEVREYPLSSASKPRRAK